MPDFGGGYSMNPNLARQRAAQAKAAPAPSPEPEEQKATFQCPNCGAEMCVKPEEQADETEEHDVTPGSPDEAASSGANYNG